MKTIFKGTLAALTIAGASLAVTAPAQAGVDVGIGVYGEPGYVSVNYRDRHRCGYYDRWGYYHRYSYSYRYSYCRNHRPYHRAYYKHSYCRYHPYSWSCRHHRR